MNRVGFLGRLGLGSVAVVAAPIARAVAPSAPTATAELGAGTMIAGDAVAYTEGAAGYAYVYANGATSLIRTGFPTVRLGTETEMRAVQHFVWREDIGWVFQRASHLGVRL